MSKARDWCITLFGNNTYELKEAKETIEDRVDGESTLYAIAGRETCPQTQREHIHVYVEFNNPRAMGGVKKWIGYFVFFYPFIYKP